MEQVLVDWLGVRVKVCERDMDADGEDVIELRAASGGEQVLRIYAGGITAISRNIGGEATRPVEPVRRVAVGDVIAGGPVSRELPAIFLRPGSESADAVVLRSTHEIEINVDLAALVFFCLTRYEEIHEGERDPHDRFPARDSLASRNGFLTQPIVDDWVIVLSCCFRRLWPGQQLKPSSFEMHLTHDIDFLNYGEGVSLGAVIRKCLAYLVTWEPCAAVRALRGRITPGHGTGLYRNLEWIASESGKRGLRSRFFFMTGGPLKHVLDGDYLIGDPEVIAIVRQLRQGGCAIGIHPSYRTPDDYGLLEEEVRNFREVVGDDAIRDGLWSRQHYLRWHSECTPLHLFQAGVDVDSTLGYADAAGFRCGTCKPFMLFDVGKRRKLPVREVPLIAMDVTLLDRKYGGGRHPSVVLESVRRLKDECRRVKGTFTLNWHNTRLLTRAQRGLYRDVLDA